MSILSTDTAEGLTLEREIAGVGSRFVAGVIDGLILSLGMLLTMVALILILGADATGIGAFAMGLFIGGVLLIVAAYGFVLHVITDGRTPGKRVLGLRVKSSDGYPASTLQYLLRALFTPIDAFFAIPLPLGLILIGASDRHQRLGDLVAGTLVLREQKGRGRRDEPFPALRWSTLEPKLLPLSPGLAGRWSLSDRAFLRTLLARGEPPILSELSEEARRALFVRTAKLYAKRVGVERFDDARKVLKELYLFLREHPPR